MTLKRADLWSLEEYSTKRAEFRTRVLAHKKDRQLLIGDHLLLIFEDQLTVRYQIQEMLRIEKVFEASAIQDELDAYNPLIPDGDNFKCTLLIQYDDIEVRKQRLKELVGIEDSIWLEFGQTGKILPIADEDMERDYPGKTSAVHFLRYQLTPEQVSAARGGATLQAGVDHSAYPTPVLTVPDNIRKSLVGDLT